MTGQTNFLQALGWAVVNSLWQLALLWVVYQLLTAVFKTAKPSAKSFLAGSLLLTGFAWFIYTFILVYITNDPVTIITGGMLHTEAGVADSFSRIIPFTSVIYLVLLIVPVFRFIRNYRYVQVIRQYGLSRIDPQWRLFVKTIAERMGILKPVHVWLSEFVTSPVTVGWLKPVILVPIAAINNLNTQQMEAVLLHELSHIRRYDYIINVVISFIRVILYFNPFAKAFVKIVETEREKSCDEMVLQFQYSSYEYASALLALEKLSREQRLLMLAASGSGKSLLHRVEAIMGVQPKQKFSFHRLGVILASALLVISFNYFMTAGQQKGSGKRVFNNGLAASLTTVTNNTGEAFFISEQPLHNVSFIQDEPARKYCKPSDAPNIADAEQPASIMNVRYTAAEPAVALDESEEAMIKETVESSRKVIEKTQWKAIESTLADVFSEQEKKELQSAFEKEINRFDWNKWEYKLRQAYDNVNWEKVNLQLNDALSKLRTDSLVRVYNDAMVNLNLAQREMKARSLTGIPDSDITLKTLAEKQRQLQRELQKLKAARNKKVVHL